MSDANGTHEFGAIRYAPDYRSSEPHWPDIEHVFNPHHVRPDPVREAVTLPYALPEGRPSKDELFLAIAHLVATRSTCSRMQVGCVITDEAGEKIAVGYNGGPKGGKNECRRQGAGLCGHIHAEVNAALKTTFDGDKVAYVTISPCEGCAVALVNVGVRRVVVSNVYRDRAGIDILEEVGIKVTVVNAEVLGAKP